MSDYSPAEIIDAFMARAARVITSELVKDGKEATTAIQLAHNGLTELRRAAYHAPFRVERPEPEYDGIGVVEPLPSQLTDIPTNEY